MYVIDELVAQGKVLLLCDTSKVVALSPRPARRVGRHGKPYWQYLWLQPDLGCDTKEQLDDVRLDVFSNSHGARPHRPIDEVHERHREDVVLQEVFFFAVDERIIESHRISNNAFVERSCCDLGYAGVYLLGGGELQAQVRCRGSRFIVEYCGECLETTANIAQGLAVVGKVLCLLPLRLVFVSATSYPGLGYASCTSIWL